VAGWETRPDLGQGANILIERFTTAGTLVSDRSFDSPAHQDDEATGVAVDAAGNIYVAGTERRDDLGQGLNGLVLKYDAGLDLQWQFTVNNGAVNGDDVAAAVASGMGHVVMAGTMDQSDLGQGRNWLVDNLVDPSPCPADVVAGAPAPVVIYPDPVAGDQCTAAFRLTRDASEVAIEVYDLNFRLVYRGDWRGVSKAQDGVTLSGLSRWTPGLYLLKVRATLNDGTKQVFDAARLVVRR